MEAASHYQVDWKLIPVLFWLERTDYDRPSDSCLALFRKEAGTLGLVYENYLVSWLVMLLIP